jgi:hypothetical protein
MSVCFVPLSNNGPEKLHERASQIVIFVPNFEYCIKEQEGAPSVPSAVI